MRALVSADELARDVAGAEALLQRHRERKVRSGRGRGEEGEEWEGGGERKVKKW